jgi:hemerythrin-like domain-containing protein
VAKQKTKKTKKTKTAKAAKAAKTKTTKKKRAPAKTRTAAKKRSAAKKTAARRPAAARKGARKKPGALGSAATAVRGAVAGAVAAVTTRMPSDTDALALLEADHRRMEDLLKQGEDTTARAVKARAQLLSTITRELDLHEMKEEQILYPALKAHPEARDIVLEGFQEHHVADLLVKELHEVAKDDERWGAKFKVLKENIEHHIQEEEGPMFRTARGVFSREELQAMGAQMQKMQAAQTRKST